MSRPVLIDVDGVLAMFNPEFLRLLNLIKGGDKLGYPCGLPEPNTWSWFRPAGFSSETIREAWSFVTKWPEWWRELRPYPDTRQFLTDLNDLQNRNQIVPYFVTSRPNQAVADATHCWLVEHGARRPNVVVVGTGTKAEVAKATGAVAILDDHGPNFDGMPASTKCFLLSRPWNRDDLTGRKQYADRVLTLQSFLDRYRGPQVIPAVECAA